MHISRQMQFTDPFSSALVVVLRIVVWLGVDVFQQCTAGWGYLSCLLAGICSMMGSFPEDMFDSVTS